MSACNNRKSATLSYIRNKRMYLFLPDSVSIYADFDLQRFAYGGRSLDVLPSVFEELGCKLTLQIGRSKFEPSEIQGAPVPVECYRYKDSLLEDIQEADLVISHAGAGSCLEVLGAGKPLIVVINEELMNNHQLELAQKLAEDGHLFYCTCGTLAETLLTRDFSSLKPFAPGQPQKFASFMDQMMGIS